MAGAAVGRGELTAFSLQPEESCGLRVTGCERQWQVAGYELAVRMQTSRA